MRSPPTTPRAGSTAVFLVNRSQTDEVTLEIDASHLGDVVIRSVQTLHDEDIHAANTRQDQERIKVKPNATALLDRGVLRLTLPPVSWTAVALAESSSTGPTP